MQFFQLSYQRLDPAIEFPGPVLQNFQFGLSLFERVLCLSHGHVFSVSGLAQIGHPGAGEGLFGLLQCLGAAADLALPVHALLVFQPELGPQHVRADILQGRTRLARVNNEAGSQGFQGFDGSNMGSWLRHDASAGSDIPRCVGLCAAGRGCARWKSRRIS